MAKMSDFVEPRGPLLAPSKTILSWTVKMYDGNKVVDTFEYAYFGIVRDKAKELKQQNPDKTVIMYSTNNEQKYIL